MPLVAHDAGVSAGFIVHFCWLWAGPAGLTHKKIRYIQEAAGVKRTPPLLGYGYRAAVRWQLEGEMVWEVRTLGERLGRNLRCHIVVLRELPAEVELVSVMRDQDSPHASSLLRGRPSCHVEPSQRGGPAGSRRFNTDQSWCHSTIERYMSLTSSRKRSGREPTWKPAG